MYPRIDVDNDSSSASQVKHRIANLHRAERYLRNQQKKDNSKRGFCLLRESRVGTFDARITTPIDTRTSGHGERTAWSDLSDHFEELQKSCKDAPISNWKEVNILCSNVALAVNHMMESGAICKENIEIFTDRINILIDSILSKFGEKTAHKDIVHDLRTMLLTDLVSFAAKMPITADKGADPRAVNQIRQDVQSNAVDTGSIVDDDGSFRRRY